MTDEELARYMWEAVPGRGRWDALRPELRRDWAVSVRALLDRAGIEVDTQRKTAEAWKLLYEERRGAFDAINRVGEILIKTAHGRK